MYIRIYIYTYIDIHPYGYMKPQTWNHICILCIVCIMYTYILLLSHVAKSCPERQGTGLRSLDDLREDR